MEERIGSDNRTKRRGPYQASDKATFLRNISYYLNSQFENRYT